MPMQRPRRAAAPRLVLAALASLVLAACGSSPDEGPSTGSTSGDLLAAVKEKQVIRVANTQANPPWNFVDGPEGLAGYDVDVAREVARRIGIEKVEFLPGTFENFIPGVKAGRFDIVISGQTITEERKREVGFSIPYQLNGVGILVAEDDTAIQDAQDLGDKTIAVTAGTTNEEQVREDYPDADVKTYKNATLALTDVARGRADACVVSRFQGTFLAARNDIAVKAVGGIVDAEVNAMTFEKGETEFKAAVDKAVREMIEDGTLTRISQKWLELDMVDELRNAEALGS